MWMVWLGSPPHRCAICYRFFEAYFMTCHSRHQRSFKLYRHWLKQMQSFVNPSNPPKKKQTPSVLRSEWRLTFKFRSRNHCRECNAQPKKNPNKMRAEYETSGCACAHWLPLPCSRTRKTTITKVFPSNLIPTSFQIMNYLFRPTNISIMI